MPYSGSPGWAARPSIIFMPGQIPPESCQPPPEPPSHSPKIARAATSLRSASLKPPVSDSIWPVARMQAVMMAARRFVETASREPLGMSLTLLTISSPRPGPTSWASTSASVWPEPSSPEGIIPAAMTAALSSPR